MRPSKTNPRIAIFCDYFEQSFQANLVRLCLKELATRDCTSVIINGNNLARNSLYQDPGVFLFDYARDSFDGIIALGGSISSYSGAANTKAFLSRFTQTPLVNIALDLPGFSTSMTDNNQGVADIMEHLVFDHHFTKILFLSKSEGEGDGELRLAAFEESLKKLRLPSDPRLIVPSVLYEQPNQQASYIFDHQKMVPGRDFEAIFGVDTYSISLIYPYLTKRGYSAPKDFAIAAFDLPVTYDFPFKLTCSAQNFELMAKNAVDSLFAKIAGIDKVTSCAVKPFFVFGTSCGCHDPLNSIMELASLRSAVIAGEQHSIHTVVSEIKSYLAHNPTHAYRSKILGLIEQFETHYVDDRSELQGFLEDRLLIKEVQYGAAGLLVRALKLCGPHDVLAQVQDILLEHIKSLSSDILAIEGQFALQIHHSNSVTRNLLNKSFPPENPELISKTFIEALDEIGVTKSMCFLFPKDNQASIHCLNKHGQISATIGIHPPTKLTDAFFETFLSQGSFIFYPLFFDTEIQGILGVELPFEYWHDSVAIETLRSLFSNTLHSAFLIQEKEESLKILKESQNQIIHAEKLAILEKLVQELSHEINTPIGNSLTAAGFIKEQADKVLKIIYANQVSRSQLIKYMESIEESSESLLATSKKMAGIINNFQMLMVNDPTQEKSTLYLSDFFATIIKTVQKSNKMHRVAINFACPSHIRVKTYPHLLKEVLVNLLYNSFSHAFGTQLDGRIEIDIGETVGELEITFGDNGRGLSDEQKPSIFEPFNHQMTANARPGIGLYIVYSIVVLKLDGSISLTNQDKPGLSFRIRLPILDKS